MKITLYQDDLPENHKLTNAQSVAIDAESLGLNYKSRDKLCLLQLCAGDDDVFIDKKTDTTTSLTRRVTKPKKREEKAKPNSEPGPSPPVLTH